MNIVEKFIERNHTFATTEYKPDMAIMPTLRTIIVSCVDPRDDPAHVLGIKAGEAAVIRNVGGRFVPSALQTLGMLRRLAQDEDAIAGSPWNLVFLQHTDCGITHFLDTPETLAAYFGVNVSSLWQLAISDPHAAVRIDIEAAKADPHLPASFLVSGLVYDVATGLVEVVVPPSPLHADGKA